MSCYYYNRLTNSFYGDSKYTDALLQVMWHITNACRLDCKLCFSKSLRTDRSELTTHQVENAIGLLMHLGVRKIDLSGGEPLLSPHLAFISKCCNDSGIVPTITTSGFGTEPNITWIENNYEQFSRIIISLDGPEIVHNSLRGNCQAYEKFLEFYERMSRKKCDRIRINTVVSRPVLSCVKDLCLMINEMAPVEWCCIQPHPINTVDGFDIYSTTQTEFDDFVAECQSNIKSSSISLLTRNNVDYSSYWVLYPNQHICHLTVGNQFDEEYILTPDNIFSIKEAVKKHPQLYVKPISNNYNAEADLLD